MVSNTVSNMPVSRKEGCPNLMDLPSEMIQKVVDAAVDIVGRRKLVRLRVVNKFFAEDILRAISAAEVEISTAKLFSRDIITRILLRRLRRQNPSHSPFFSMVVETVNFLMRLDPDQSNQQRQRYTHALCAADVDIEGLFPLTFINFSDEITNNQTINRYLLRTTDPMPVDASEADRDHISETPVLVNAMVAAAYVGNVDMVQTLIDRGADVNASSGVFEPALEQAAMQGNYTTVLMLLENGANPNLYDSRETILESPDRKAALCKACFGGFEDIVFLLLEPKYGLSPRKVTMRIAMLEAVRGGHEKLAMRLLDRCAWKDPAYLAVLHGDIFLTAVEYGHESIVRRMLLTTGDPRVTVRHNDSLDHKHPNRNDPRTIVELASLCGRASILPLLLDNGATRTHSALSHATRNGHVDVAQVLLDHPPLPGQEVDISSMLNGWSPRKKRPTRDDCLERIETPDTHSLELTPLHAATRNGEIAMVDFLLKRGANPDAVVEHRTYNRIGVTALIRAVESNNYEMVRILLEAGANPDGVAKTLPFEKPIYIAETKEYYAISKLLAKYGASPFDTRTSPMGHHHRDMRHGNGCEKCVNESRKSG